MTDDFIKQQETMRDAIQLAIYYCEEHIESTDSSWTRQGLETHLEKFKELLKII